MKLKNLATIKTNLETADFWIIRKGSVEAIGKPVREFYREHIGIRVFRTEILVPDYLFYTMEMLHNDGMYKPIARGTLTLVHITT